MANVRLHAAIMLMAVARVAAQSPSGDSESACGPLANAYGPYDYRTDLAQLPVVDRVHFPPKVENLIAGNAGRLGGDLDYTLRAFPNHHRALVAVMKYGLKLKTDQPSDLPRPVECYFDRAIRFRPLDPLTRLIYATYLTRHDRREDALAQLRVADETPDLMPITKQSIGLLYADLAQFERARETAWKIIELGVDPKQLIGKLSELGQWQEPPAGAATKPTDAKR